MECVRTFNVQETMILTVEVAIHTTNGSALCKLGTDEILTNMAGVGRQGSFT